MKTKDPKKMCQRIHAIGRMKARYGAELDEEDYWYLTHRIQSRKEVCLKEYTDARVYKVHLKGQNILAVYDLGTQQIKTFLPKDSWQSKWLDEENGR